LKNSRSENECGPNDISFMLVPTVFSQKSVHARSGAYTE